jgi:hypothetical protein
MYDEQTAFHTVHSELFYGQLEYLGFCSLFIQKFLYKTFYPFGFKLDICYRFLKYLVTKQFKIAYVLCKMKIFHNMVLTFFLYDDSLPFCIENSTQCSIQRG